jgi:polar amino acid transport system substrate-binding protein
MLRLVMWLVCCLSCTALAQTELRVVTELSPPHQTLQHGKVGGLSTELVQAVLNLAGVSADIELYPWARSFHIARTQPNVLIYNMARTADRESEFRWIGTVASYQLGFVALGWRKDISITSLSDATGYTIAVQRDDISANFLMSKGFKPGQQLVIAADITESWQLLLNGKVDLVIDDPVALADMADMLGVAPHNVQFVYAIPELRQHTWLAASLQTSPALIGKLRHAHSVVAATERYVEIMSSAYQHPQ